MVTETAAFYRIELFGSLRLIQGKHVTTHFRLQKAALLLAYLALYPRYPHRRERLVDLFWPGLESQAGRDNLSTTLSILRRELRAGGMFGSDVLDADRHTISLRPERYVTDVAEFEGLLKQAGRAALVADRAHLLKRAIALYRGDLLAGYYEDWALAAQAAYRQRYQEALLDWAGDLETQQDWQEVRRVAEQAVHADPLCEEATLLLMRVMARQGHAARAIETFQLLQQRLRKALDVEPSQELCRFMERLQRDPNALFTPLPAATEPANADPAVAVGADAARSPSSPSSLTVGSGNASNASNASLEAGEPAEAIPPRHNLPLLLSSFIGREQEMAEIERLLVQHRLLTLTGIGGCGKTRLALQLGNAVLARFSEGVWFVELAGLADPTLVVNMVARALDIKEESGRSLLQTLTDSLKGQRMLLILDNCEHLLEASAALVWGLLRACPHLRVLATSRQPLALAGEQTYRVPCLSLPEAQQAVAPETLSAYSAVQLFVERAQRVVSGFAVTRENTQALIEICQRLDGIPLAIELAATRVRSLTVEDLSQRLDDRFRLLSGGDRMALPRQQTLLALMDWSYDLLTAEEKRLLVWLAAFPGGWTLETVEAVWDGGEAALDLLSSLVDKSLVIVEEREEATRYRMLETVRLYGKERLLAGGEAERVRGKHRDHFLALAEEAEPQLNGPQQRHWLERLEAEHDNLRAALAWCVEEQQDVNTGLRLCRALQQFWWARGYYAEGRQWCRQTLERARGLEETREYASVLNVAGLMAYSQSDYAVAWRLHEASMTVQRKLQDRRRLASSLNHLGNIATAQGKYVAARSYYEESLALWQEFGDVRGVAIAIGNLGNVARHRGEHAAAMDNYERSLAMRKQIADWTGITNMLNRLGDTACDQGDDTRARAFYEQSLRAAREIRYRQGSAYALLGLGVTSRRQQDIGVAQTLSDEALRLFQELGDRRGTAAALDNLGHLAHDRGDPVAARRMYEESLTIYREIGNRSGQINTLLLLGNLALAQANYAEARKQYAERLRVASELDDRQEIVSSREKLASTLAAERAVAAALAEA